MPVVRQVKNEILPLNLPSNNAFSFSKGSSLIQFMIASNPVAMMNNTLKLKGKFRLNRPGSTFSVPLFPNNNTNSSVGTAYDLKLNSRIGIDSAFERITVSTQLGQTCESVKQYGRLQSILNPLKNNQSDFDGKMQKNPGIASRVKIGANQLNTEVDFCIPIGVGMFSNEYTALGRNGMNGLQIQFALSPDMNCFQSSEADGNSCFYEILNCSLVFDTLHFDAETERKMDTPSTGAISFNTFSSLYSVINSNDAQINYNLGLSKVLAITSTALPTTHMNNVTTDGFSTGELKNTNANGVYDSTAKLNRLEYIRNGVKSPLDFEIQTTIPSTQNRPKVEVIDNLKSAFNARDSPDCLISLNTEVGLKTKTNLDGTALRTISTVVTEAEDEPCFGLGINQDVLTKVGRDFKSATFATRILSDLDGSSPNSLSTFVLNKNVLQFSPQGVVVMS
jgi:hypothetical protein